MRCILASSSRRSRMWLAVVHGVWLAEFSSRTQDYERAYKWEHCSRRGPIWAWDGMYCLFLFEIFLFFFSFFITQCYVALWGSYQDGNRWSNFGSTGAYMRSLCYRFRESVVFIVGSLIALDWIATLWVSCFFPSCDFSFCTDVMLIPFKSIVNNSYCFDAVDHKTTHIQINYVCLFVVTRKVRWCDLKMTFTSFCNFSFK